LSILVKKERTIMKKRKCLRSILSILLTVILVVGILPASAAQKAAGETVSRITGEEISLREENVKHFLCEDGTYVAAVYAEPVHYQDETGDWQEIDNTLQAKAVDGKTVYEPAASGLDIKIPKKFEGEQELTVSKDGYTIGLGVSAQNEDVRLSKAASITAVERLASEELKADLNVAQTNTSSGENASAAQSGTELIEKANEEAMKVEDLSSAVSYVDIFPGADLEYIVEPGKIKENIVVKEAQDAYAYKFNLDLGGLVAVPRENGSIDLLENANDAEALFSLLAPFMYDAAGAESAALTMTLAADGTLVLVADADWINDEVREFPVVIDPTITANASGFQDAYISTAATASNYSVNFENYIGKGLLGTRRTYLKFELPSMPTNCVIHSANLKVRQTNSDYSPAGTSLRAYKVTGAWNAGTITWSNQPLSKTLNGAGTPTVSTSISNSNVEYTLNITSAVQSWRASGGNYGFMFATNSESSNGQIRIASVRHSTSSYRPSATIVYHGTATITYSGNGHTGGTVPTAQTVSTPGSVTLSQPGTMVKADHAFGGWLCPDGVIRQAGAAYSWSTATTLTWALTAVWIPPTTVNRTEWATGNQAATSPVINITSSANWTITKDQTWLSVSSTSGSGNGAFTISVTANTGTAAREGTVTIQAGSTAIIINVTQLDQVGTNISSYFTQSSSTYNHALATEAMYWSYAAYNPVPAGIISPIVPGSFMDTEDTVPIVLNQYGFENIAQYNYTNTPINTAAHTIAHRRIAGSNGTTRSLIVVAIRGTAADVEWITDLLSAFESQRAGFLAARTNAQANFNAYMSLYGQYMETDRVVLITGHSLGAAVANLLAADLTSDSNWGSGKVYAYTFATPNVQSNISTTYTNIFNILNRSDVVTLIPRSLMPFNNAWGRHGIDIPIAMNPTLTGIDVPTNHMMSTYLSWMQSYSNLTYSQIQDISASDVSMGLLPRIISFKCPVGITVHNSDGEAVAFASQENSDSGGIVAQGVIDLADSDVVSWITEDGEKVFFVPCGSDISDAGVVAYDSGTMRFSIATIDASSDQPYELKTFENISLYTGKEFISNNISGDIEDVQLLVVEDGEVIGEVAEDGTETIF
jgi:hypothetical protein